MVTDPHFARSRACLTGAAAHAEQLPVCHPDPAIWGAGDLVFGDAVLGHWTRPPESRAIPARPQ